MWPLPVALVLALVAGACAASRPPPGTAAVASAPAATAPDARRRQTVAVFPFDNNAVTGRERLDFLRDWLADVVGGRLRDSKELRLLERRELLRILQEQKLGTSALASRDGKLQLGKIAGAQTMVFGGFTAVGDALQIDARIVDVESSMVLKSATMSGGASEARALGEKLADQIVHDLGLTIARRTTAAGLADDQALRAAEYFYEGLALEKKGKTEAAIESYRRALEINREDEEARQRLKKLLGASS